MILRMSEIELEYTGELTTHCVHKESGAEITMDGPKDIGGPGKHFSPTDLTAASLGGCMLTLLGMQAKRLGVDVKGTKARVRKEYSPTPPRRIKTIRVEIFCPQEFDQEVTQALISAMASCPVHFSLHPEVEQQIEYHWGKAL